MCRKQCNCTVHILWNILLGLEYQYYCILFYLIVPKVVYYVHIAQYLDHILSYTHNNIIIIERGLGLATLLS